MRWWRLTLLALAGALTAVAGTVLAVVVNVVTGGTARWLPWSIAAIRHPLWCTGGATVAVAAAALLVWEAQRWYDRGHSVLVPTVPRPESWVVDRAAEVNQVVAALRRRSGGTVAITTVVHGAGGFGKTTVAKMVRADRRIRRRFSGGVYWVTLGRDGGLHALAGLVNDLITRLEPDRPVTFTDAGQAGEHLAAILMRGPQRLLVLDDVWREEQLAAFPVAGRCARLVTTRIPSLATGIGVTPVRVNQMSDKQARALLSAGLPPLPPAVVSRLIAETGRWPLLLRLVNKILADQVRLESDTAKIAEDLLRRLSHHGALEVDQLTGAAAQPLDINKPAQREKAVRATIQVGTSLLRDNADHDRFAELGVFAKNETIPVTVISRLWHVTGKLDQTDTRALCARLADLALLNLVPGSDGGAITIHDVIRDFIRKELGSTYLEQLHQVLLDAAADGLPRAAAASPGSGTVTAWWELGESEWYMREHLIEHMLAAGRTALAEEVAADLRWVSARLQAYGPAGPYADLALIGTSRAYQLARFLEQAAHLLAPTDPAHFLIDILHSRVSHDPAWAVQAQALTTGMKRSALVNSWRLPDIPDSSLRRTLTGHTMRVEVVAISPDGTRLAAGDWDGTVRIWDLATGQQHAALIGHTGRVTAIAIAPDGTWLATAGWDRTVRIWESDTGRHRATLTGHSGPVETVAIAPDGTWFATASWDRTVRIWDVATKRKRIHLIDQAVALAIAPNGTWLATIGIDKQVRIWDPATGQKRAFPTDHTDHVTTVAIAPEGNWLATSSWDRTVRIWDSATGKQRATLTGHTGWVTAVAVAPHGSWLATASHDRTVRIWDPATGQQRAVLTGHTGELTAMAIALDCSWLATVSSDWTIRVWDPDAEQLGTTENERFLPLSGVSVAPDGTWLATASHDRTVRIWDSATGQLRTILTGHTGDVTAVAVAPDGTWLASASDDGSVRIWDSATGQLRTILTGHTSDITAVAVAPDGTWLATVGKVFLTFWDLVTGQQRATYLGAAATVAVAPDGTWLVTGSPGGTVRVWDLATGRRRNLTCHTNEVRTWVRAVAIAPDGTWLASASDDGSVRIWDWASGQLRATLTGHTSDVTAVAITPDGAWLASASADGSVRVWDPSTALISAIMRVDGRIKGCAWSRANRSLAVVGDAGLYRFTFKEYRGT